MTLYILSALFNLYVGWRIVPALAAWPAAQAALLLVVVACAVLMPLGLMSRRAKASPWAEPLAWAGLLAMGLFSSLFVLTVLRDVLLLVALVVFDLVPQALPVPVVALATWTAVAVPVLALLATVLGFWNARRTAAVVRVDVPVAGLPAPLHGFSVAQLSDVHVGPTIRRKYIEAIVARVNGLDADMVAITGDLVDGRVAELSDHVAPLARLRSRHGSFFVTGNHEYYSGAHDWIVALRGLGIHVLMNEHVVLRHGPPAGTATAPLVLAGVADWSAHHFDPAHKSDPQAALRGAPADAGAKVLLAHQPRTAPAAADAGFDLQLSGHTHGGQFWPWNHFVRFQQPFTAGLHRLRNLWVYTSRGTGYWGPPKRFGAPSEITLLRLVPAA